MKTAAAPISICRFPTRRNASCVRVFQQRRRRVSRACFRSSRTGSSVATRRFTVVNPDQREPSAAIGSRRDRPGGRPAKRAIRASDQHETYLRDGRFDQDRMLEVFEQLASGTAKGGFPLSRIVCHMDWAAEGRSYVDNLVEFESRVNDVWRRHDDAVICVYDLAKFGGDTVVDIMRHASDDHHRWHPAAESVLYAAGGIPARASRAARPDQRASPSTVL